MSAQTSALIALRKVVGTEPREIDLINLLAHANNDVNVAANNFFEGGLPSGPPLVGGPAPIHGRPIAAGTHPPPAAMVQVTCPPNRSAGDDLQVQTEQGLMRVKVPTGVAPGATFLMRMPTSGGAPPGHPMQPMPPHYAPPPNHHQQHAALPGQQQQPQYGYPGQPQQPQYGYPGQPQQPQYGYPGQQQQPNVIYQQQQRPQTVHVVHSSPYGGYGGYGYGYDPFFAGTMGLMGGMLIADAMWY